MRDKGLTLIEVLIAMVILAFIAGGIWQSMSIAAVTKERAERKGRSIGGAGVAFQQIIRDLEGAYLYASLDFLGRSGDGEQRTKTVFVGTDQGNQDQIHFASLMHVRYLKDAKESEQAEVGYLLENDPDQPEFLILKKREVSPPDAEPDQGGEPVILLRGVKGLNFRYFDSKKGEFVDSWDSTEIDHLNALPRAVEVMLEVQDPNREEGLLRLETTVLLGMAPGPSDF